MSLAWEISEPALLGCGLTILKLGSVNKTVLKDNTFTFTVFFFLNKSLRPQYIQFQGNKC